MARRKKNDPFLGLIILLVIVITILVYFKENVVDKVEPGVWGLLIVLVIFSIAWRIWSGFRQRQRDEAEAAAQEQEARQKQVAYMAWGVEKAISIATHQKWVSPHRLKTQVHVTDKQAAEFLQWGEAAGMLKQEVNGRYYVTDLGMQVHIKAIEGPSSS